MDSLARKEVVTESQITSTKYQKQILGSGVAGLGIESMDIMLLSFVMSTLISEFNISSAVAGSLSFVTNIGMLIGGILFGILADKHGRVKMFIYTVILFAVGTALIGFAQNTFMLYALRFITGVGAGGEYGIVMALLAGAFPKEKSGRVNSYTTIGGQFGNILAALGAALIIPIFGWRVLFIVAGIVSLPLIFFLKRIEESPKWVASKKQNKTVEKISLKELFNSRKKAIITVSLITMTTIQIAGYFGLVIWLPTILQERLNLNVSGSSLWTISTLIGMCLGMLVFGRVMDRFGAKISYSIFLIASAGSMFIYVYASSAVGLLIGGSIVGFFSNGMMAGYGPLISSYYPDRIRTTAINTVFNTGRAIGGFSPIIIGFLLQNYTITYAMGFLATLYVISLVVLLSLKSSEAY